MTREDLTARPILEGKDWALASIQDQSVWGGLVQTWTKLHLICALCCKHMKHLELQSTTQSWLFSLPYCQTKTLEKGTGLTWNCLEMSRSIIPRANWKTSTTWVCVVLTWRASVTRSWSGPACHFLVPFGFEGARRGQGLDCCFQTLWFSSSCSWERWTAMLCQLD